MKKNLYLLCVIVIAMISFLGGCNHQMSTDDLCKDAEAEIMQFLSGDVLITIYKGAPIATKGSSNIDYYTVTGQLNSTEYSVYVENVIEDDDLVFSKAFSQEKEWLFTEVYYHDQYVRTDFAELDEYGPEVIETKGSRRPGEKYGDCVKRVHAALKAAMEENNPVTCEFINCGAIAAVCGIVDCAEYGDQF